MIELAQMFRLDAQSALIVLRSLTQLSCSTYAVLGRQGVEAQTLFQQVRATPHPIHTFHALLSCR